MYKTTTTDKQRCQLLTIDWIANNALGRIKQKNINHNAFTIIIATPNLIL